MSECRRRLFANCKTLTSGASVPNGFQLGAKRGLPKLEYNTSTPLPWKMLSGIDVIWLLPMLISCNWVKPAKSDGTSSVRPWLLRLNNLVQWIQLASDANAVAEMVRRLLLVQLTEVYAPVDVSNVPQDA